jgi:ubiquinol-cytochrome c reductase cytochrome b subunit
MKYFQSISSHLLDYPSPVVGYLNSFGSLSGICLVIQLVTGVLLVAHYTPHVALAFISVEHILRDVNDGWLLRFYHSNGASVFFICIYLHIQINEDSSARISIWLSGSLLYMLVIATAFMGYILPWGQISFWGATVITNLFAAIPYVGIEIATWLWGGFSVDNPTLNRFFSFHYLLPFLVSAVLVIHLILLHFDGSTNSDDEFVEFYFFYFIKDLIVVLGLLLVFFILVFLMPEYLSHYDNSNMANSNVTPAHLVPEWYFLPFYGALRAVPDKFGGLVIIALTLVDILLGGSWKESEVN